MAFKTSCIELMESFEEGSAERSILSFLLDQAVGHKNVKSWPKIEAHLTTIGIDPPKKESFQVRLLGATRKSDSFIGSTKDGYFIIDSIEDAFACLSFYLKRISEEQTRVERLRRLMEEEYVS